MNRESLVAAGYHFSESKRHHDKYFRTLDNSATPVACTEELSFVDRFNLLLEKVEPLLRPQGIYDRDWYLTPEVPLTGEVEGNEFTVFLSIQVQKGPNNYRTLAPYIRTEDEDRPGGIRGMHESLDSCVRWQKSERKGERLETLDHVEEAVDVYLKTVASLTQKQLNELGFPSEYIPEDIQLSLEDTLAAD